MTTKRNPKPTLEQRIKALEKSIRILEARKMVIGGLPSGASIEISELDGTPDIIGVKHIVVDNGLLTDLGGGLARLTSSADITIETLLWNSHPDELADGFLSVPYQWTHSGTLTNIRATCARPPSGGAADFDVQLNSATILSSHVSIASGGTISSDYTPTTTAFARNDKLQIIGGTMHGILDVVLYFDYQRGA